MEIGQILDTNPGLFFHLQQQKLIEYIRQGQIAEAIQFAQEELAPRGEENVRFYITCAIPISLNRYSLNSWWNWNAQWLYWLLIHRSRVQSRTC